MRDGKHRTPLAQRPWFAGLGLALAMSGVLVSAGLLCAQELPIETRPDPATRESRAAPSRLLDTRSMPPAAGIYGHDVGVRHDPAFIAPLAGRYRTNTGAGRLGLSGWTAPNVGPAQHGANEVAGWFSLGFSITWGGPP